MKNSLPNALLLVLIAVCCFARTESFAQSADTVQHRMIIGMLPDSTEFQYEIGEITRFGTSALEYLAFKDSAGPLDENFLKTKAFQYASGDSIRFSRFANFDDRYQFRFPDTAVSDADRISLMSAADAYEQGRAITPSSTYFGSTSQVLYVVELRRASDNAVLARFDTLSAYVNGSGALRYSCSDQSLNLRFIALPSAYTSTDVYLAVRVISTLPSGSSFTYTATKADHQLPADPRYNWFANQYQDLPSGGLKPSNGSVTKSRAFWMTGPAAVNDDALNLTFESNDIRMLRVDILDAAGKVVSSEFFPAQRGANGFHVDLHGLSSGIYIVRLTSGVTSVFAKFEYKK